MILLMQQGSISSSKLVITNHELNSYILPLYKSFSSLWFGKTNLAITLEQLNEVLLDSSRKESPFWALRSVTYNQVIELVASESMSWIPWPEPKFSFILIQAKKIMSVQ